MGLIAAGTVAFDAIEISYSNDNKYLSSELVRNGMAWHYKRYSKSKELADLEIKAREEKIGLWSDPSSITFI